ncbi:MAG TPA: DUF4325 domain-containing protein [Aquella sp.]|nr:DUF4325 domain-containing protein [Aquella sp.]
MICKNFSVTRMTATRHLQALIKQGKIIKTGKTSDTQYYLTAAKNKDILVNINNKLDEFQFFMNYLEPELKQLPVNQYKILEYCITELVNNAKDHSHGTRLQVKTQWENSGLQIEIIDNGIGIFKNLQQVLKLIDLQEGLLALSKGKLTTDPENHTGEGVFFSSRMVDQFVIEANGIRYLKDNFNDDWTYQQLQTDKGTRIILFVNRDCTRTIKEVFLAYTEPDSLSFNKTEILVELAQFKDERLISRSQAKRILEKLDKFSRIVFDFRHIETVGQGFVDEVFRVFQNQHPTIQITYRNANDDVIFMIKRGLTNS